jgi:hypothetical protein
MGNLVGAFPNQGIDFFFGEELSSSGDERVANFPGENFQLNEFTRIIFSAWSLPYCTGIFDSLYSGGKASECKRNE